MVLRAFWGSFGLILASLPAGTQREFDTSLPAGTQREFDTSLPAGTQREFDTSLSVPSVDMLFYLFSEPLGADFELPN